MTPSQKLKQMVLCNSYSGFAGDQAITAENVDALFSDLEEPQDAMNEIRAGTVETGLPCGRSRHYEAKSVAAQSMDGSWVGWTYFYGGGKHGEPSEMEWISDAYDLDIDFKTKTEVVCVFSKREPV